MCAMVLSGEEELCAHHLLEGQGAYRVDWGPEDIEAHEYEFRRLAEQRAVLP